MIKLVSEHSVRSIVKKKLKRMRILSEADAGVSLFTEPTNARRRRIGERKKVFRFDRSIQYVSPDLPVRFAPKPDFLFVLEEPEGLTIFHFLRAHNGI